MEGMKIEFMRVFIWLIFGFWEWLGKVFGCDLVGIVDEEKIEMW